MVFVSCKTTSNNKTLYLNSESLVGVDVVPIIEEAIKNGCQEIRFSKGQFRMESLLEIENSDNLRMIGRHSELTLYTLPAEAGPAIIKLYDTNHFILKNITLNSNREQFKTDRLLHSIFVYNSSHIELTNLNLLNSLGDGIQIAAEVNQDDELSKDILIRNCKTTNSTRNGLSLIHCADIRIEDSSFNLSNGSPPEAGIDIEPDEDSIRPGVYNVVIHNVEIHGNKGNGIAIPYIGVSEDITIEHCIIHQNSSGIYTCGKDINIIRNSITGNSKYGICSIRYPGFNVPPDSVVIESNTITDHQMGIYYRGFGGLITRNTIAGTKDEGIELRNETGYISTAVVNHNRIMNIQGQAAIASDIDTLEVSQNRISNCKEIGIALHAGINEVFGNQLSDCIGYSILVNDAVSHVTNNTIKNGKNYFIWFNGYEHTRTGGIISENKLYSFTPLQVPYILDTSGRITRFAGNILKVPNSKIDLVLLKSKPQVFEDTMHQVKISDE
jgi:hypothetical protein